MKKCIVCGKELTFNSKYIIRSREKDNYFYSKECVKKFVEEPDKYLTPVKHKYDFYKIENDKKINIKNQFQDLLKWKKILINLNLKQDVVS